MKLLCAFLVLTLLTMPVHAFARDTDYTEGKSFVWSPNNFSTVTTQTSTHLNSYTSLTWDNAGAGYVNNLLRNFWDFYTMEMNNINDRMISASSGYTNLPSGTWASESDHGSPTPHHEEIEYFWANTQLVAGTAYHFNLLWTKKGGTGNGSLHLIAQMGPFQQGYDFDLLRQTPYTIGTALVGSSLSTSIDVAAHTPLNYTQWELTNSTKAHIISIDDKVRVHVAIKDFATICDFNNYKKAQKQLLMDLLEQVEMNELDVMVTFAKPLSLERIKQMGLLEAAGMFNFIGTNGNGEQVTGFFLNDTEGLGAYNSRFNNRLTIDGIISFAGVIAADDVLPLAFDESVALVDVTKAALRTQLGNKHPTQRVRIRVPHVYHEHQHILRETSR